LQHELYRLEEGARRIRRKLQSGPVALLFGSEKVGLSNQDLGHCHWLMRIPTREEHGSMNLGQAVAVCLYELTRTKGIATAKKPAEDEELRARGEDVERLTRLLMEVLRASGYVKPRVAVGTEEKLRRMVRRLNLSVADAELWLGILRQIAWKVDRARKDPR